MQNGGVDVDRPSLGWAKANVGDSEGWIMAVSLPRGATSGGRAIWAAMMVVGLLLTSCGGDIIDPASPAFDEESAWTLEFTPLEPLRLVGDTLECPGVQNCNVTEDPASGNDLCMCELTGFLVNPDDPPSVPPPAWPEAPGWYPDIVYDPGSGDPGGDGGPGDACDFGCPVEVSARLACSVGVPRGAQGSCTLLVDPAEQLEYIYRWVFAGDDGSQVVKQPGGSAIWSGTVVQSGDVRVVVRIGGSDVVVASRLTVTPRNWTWDSSKRSFGQGAPGELDACMTSQHAGLTADKVGCGPGSPVLINPGPGQGFTIAQGSGPNAGLYYVTNPTTRMDLRTQLSKRFRADADKVTLSGPPPVVQACQSAYSPNAVPPQNNHSINTICHQESGFTSLVTFTWDHEGEHLALGQENAGLPANDIYASWEPIVRVSYQEAFDDADELQDEAVGRVEDEMLSIHTGFEVPFTFWHHAGSGVWGWATFWVQN